jgi:hypothetical protein
MKCNLASDSVYDYKNNTLTNFIENLFGSLQKILIEAQNLNKNIKHPIF